MAQLYPPIDPHEQGLMDVGHGHQVYWEECGNPRGKPALVIHGGPGSGATPGWRRYFDPVRYRVVLFDQRGCGRSTPSAADTLSALEANTTFDLLADIEQLRGLRRIGRWLLFGGSWGATLGLTYAETHPEPVSEAIFFSITAGLRKEIDRITRDAGRFFPDAWEAFQKGVPPEHRDGDLADAYARLLPTLTLKYARKPRATGARGRPLTSPSAPIRSLQLATKTLVFGWRSRGSSPTTGVTTVGWTVPISSAGPRNSRTSRPSSSTGVSTCPGRQTSPGGLAVCGQAPN